MFEETIFIVDDDKDIINLLKTMLKKIGYKNLLHDNGSKIMELIDTMENIPALVVLDINMPEVNGLDVLKHMRNSDKWAEVPVILLTAANDVETVKKAVKFGTNDYLIKQSLTPKVFGEKVKKWIENK